MHMKKIAEKNIRIHKIIRGVSLLFSILATIVGILFLSIFISRVGIPYNEAGRFFDGGVVYQDGAQWVYFVLTVLSFVLAFGLYRLSVASNRKSS